MQWGGSLGQIVDARSQLAVEVRSFGTFDGHVPPGGEGSVQAIILEVVRAALASHEGGLSADPRDIASAAQSLAAPRFAQLGVQGEITVQALSVSPEDHERIKAVGLKAAMEKRARLMAEQEESAATPPAMGPFALGAQVLVQWSDGQRYPGAVREVGPQHVLVAFPNGATHWVPFQYVTVA